MIMARALHRAALNASRNGSVLLLLLAGGCDGSWLRSSRDAGTEVSGGPLRDAGSHDVPHIPPRDAAGAGDVSAETQDAEATDASTGDLSDAPADSSAAQKL